MVRESHYIFFEILEYPEDRAYYTIKDIRYIDHIDFIDHILRLSNGKIN
jgi:hypothetical protein